MSTRYFLGPCGGTGGGPFETPPSELAISEIQVFAGDRIDAIELIWINGTSSPKFGGPGGGENQFVIAAGDYLAAIEGSVEFFDNSVRVSSLQLFPKKGNPSPVYGKKAAAEFRFQPIPGYQITGFFGRCGATIDALGIIVESAPSQG